MTASQPTLSVSDAASPRPSRSVPPLLITLMSVASFLLYALGVLTLHQDQNGNWKVEREEGFPVAISHLAYGTPIGAMDANVEEVFSERAPNAESRGGPLTHRPYLYTPEEAITKISDGSIPSGGVKMVSNHGAGAGMNLFATIAMGMFGAHVSSLILFYLMTVGISVAMFIWRYQDERQFGVLLYFLVVTVMLLTPLCASQIAADDMPIGGYRYFSLAAVLPALHFFFEIIEPTESNWSKIGASDLLALLVQGGVFFAIFLARSSASYLLIALAFVSIFRFYQEQQRRRFIVSLAYKSAWAGIALAFWIATVAAVLPDYVKTGRVFSVFWHRAFVSLSLSPQWPFGNLREVYDCTKYIPEGLARSGFDGNGECVWLAYPPNATRSIGDLSANLYGGEYEKVVRTAFFYVLTQYPKQVFELYFYTKSSLVWGSLVEAWHFVFQLDRAAVAKGLFVIVLAQLALFVSFIVTVVAAGVRVVDRRMLIFPAFFVASILPLYVAWATLSTVLDTVFQFYTCIALLLSLVLQTGTEMVLPGKKMRAAKSEKGADAPVHHAVADASATARR